MLLKLGLRTAALATIVSCGLIGQAVLAGPAGAVTVAKAELINGQLRLEGESSPGVFVDGRVDHQRGRRPRGPHRAVPDPGQQLHRAGLQDHDLGRRPDADRHAHAGRLHARR